MEFPWYIMPRSRNYSMEEILTRTENVEMEPAENKFRGVVKLICPKTVETLLVITSRPGPVQTTLDLQFGHRSRANAISHVGTGVLSILLTDVPPRTSNNIQCVAFHFCSHSFQKFYKRCHSRGFY